MGNVSDNAQSTAMDMMAIAQQFQDQLIAKRLPDWMGKVRVSDFTLLREALVNGLQSRRQLAKCWSKIESLDSFCITRLNTALQEKFNAGLDAKQHFLRQWYTYTSPEHSYYTSHYPTPASDYFDVSLLSAAMSNFSKAQAAEGGQHARNTLVDGPGAALTTPSVPAFATFCRDLDLGGQYQSHLEAVLEAKELKDMQSCKALLKAQYRSNLLVDAFKAHAEGVLRDAELELIIGLYTDGKLGRLEGAPVVAKQLKAFNCHLQQIVVLDVIDEGLLLNSSKRVLVYIPGDRLGAWCVAKNLEGFARKILGKRLRKDDYRQFFERFVLQRDRAGFFAAVQQRVGDVADWATRELDQHMKVYPTPLFDHLATMRIQQIKDDAAVFATPVARIDGDVALAKSERRHAQGMALLALAGLFIPAIGAALLAVMAWELLSEVFQSVKDWREGDTNAALDHLVNVGKDVALLGATAVGVAAARTLWTRSVLVDGLVPAMLEDGSEKLWNQDLAPYVSEPPPAQAIVDQSGIYRLGEQSWIEMEGYYYPVYQTESEDWYLEPYENHAPLLEHNGAGAWRLWSERPAEWRGTERMFRRLGVAYASLSDKQIGQVLLAHGLEEDHLRAVHVFANVPEAELTDTVNRFVLANRIVEVKDRLQEGRNVIDPALLEEVLELPGVAGLEGEALAEVVWEQRRVLFQNLYDKSNVSEDASVQALRRDFPSLHRLAAEQLLSEASDGDRELLVQTGRVPLPMAQVARQRAMRIRVARVFEGLFIDTPQTLDMARGVIKLIDNLPGAPQGRHWVLSDGDGLLAPRSANEAIETIHLSHQEGVFVLRDERGHALDQPGELFEVLADVFTQAQREAMNIGEPFGQQLRETLAKDVASRRQELAELMSREQPTPSFLLPFRLDDGRVGYPLSGGRRLFGFGSPRSLVAKLRYLYPSFSDSDIQKWLRSMRDRGNNLQDVLNQLEDQHELLSATLTNWQREGLLHYERNSRYKLRKELIRCWRHLIPEQPKPLEDRLRYRFSRRGLDVSSLPDLPEPISFPHVTAIDFRSMALQDLPDGFLNAFPNLVSVEITHCKLKRFPQMTGKRELLRILDLSDNKIRLDAAQVELIEECAALEYLNLSRNPLKLPFSITAMPRLTTLILRDDQLDAMPIGVESHQKLYELDMMGNDFKVLPEGLLESPLWGKGRVRFASKTLGRSATQVGAWYRPDDGKVPARLLWLDRIDAKDRDEMAHRWHLLVSDPESEEFVRVLERLVQSKDFAIDQTARDLADRIFSLLGAMEEDEALSEHLLALAQEPNCGDNALLRFVDLENRKLAWDAEHDEYEVDPEPGLLRLGGQLWRQNALEEYARRFAAGMRGPVDEVEVVLAFRVRLYKDLQLPGHPSQIRFEDVVGDIDEGVENARETILRNQDEDTLSLWMVNQSFWNKYLEHAYGSRLKLPREYRKKEQELSSRGGTRQEFDALQAQVKQWRLNQRLALTKAAMRRLVSDWHLSTPGQLV
ncbi:C-terminal novel E3 ligase, LRR-interacting [Pseudomonas guariconensis]|uniref:NEL-type E3 ubiquitin ligase domain-containing protein n=1 Tax=Pseudomonas guariconensis TaxID=1288410 RepID=UPI00088D9550|nr:NEL-type E3 ubiquitin ligase domain-containing protein [Pseudomonas guariconensis]SDB96535.1 C-terminal novel E3 ligase, LRR-interacting [Pseudomonas guariconensis]